MRLEDYAARSGRRGGKSSRCLTCALDPAILEQIHAARAQKPKPVSFPVVAEWLRDEHSITLHHNTIRNHFIAGHAGD